MKTEEKRRKKKKTEEKKREARESEKVEERDERNIEEKKREGSAESVRHVMIEISSRRKCYLALKIFIVDDGVDASVDVVVDDVQSLVEERHTIV